MDDRTLIANIPERWRACFEASDAEGLKALWAKDHTPLTYLPTERDAVFTTWQEIADYYDRVAGGLDVIRWRVWDVVADLVTSDTGFAFAYTDMYYRSKAQPDAGDQYWQGRVSFHAKRTADGWKVVHYEDSTLMQWMLPLAQQYQAPRLDALAEAVRAGRQGDALAAIEALRQPIQFWELTAVAKPPY